MCSITQNIKNIVLELPNNNSMIKSNCYKKGCKKRTRV